LKNVFETMGYADPSSDIKQPWSVAFLQNGKTQTIANDGVSDKTRVPDVLGMGLKDAVYLLENAGLKVDIAGRGKVIKQSVAAKAPLVKGETINIVLNE
jgi:cell division protein FtsI (penicillin-binding protein 3)